MNEHNPPAFPAIHSLSDGVSYANGMTLRDYFAGQALTQLGYIGRNPADYKVVARHCYGFADAMLAERFKEIK